MQNRIEVSIGKKYKDTFDTAKAFCDINDIKISRFIGKCVKEYIDSKNGKPEIIIPEKFWKLEERTKEELEALETLITLLHRKVMKELCQ